MNPWAPYRPTAANPWDLRKVAHLHRRAGFGVSHAMLQAGLAAGLDPTIQKVLTGGPTNPDFDRTSEYMASERSLPRGSTGRQLAAWWLYRILNTPHPLQEKLTLFWHNHFATSIGKVQNARFMIGQYQLLHRYALGDFRTLLQEISLDPAMMVWLDTTGSVKGKPNENYARELMELFSLGIGHYTETDIREAARAFTGYEIKNDRGELNKSRHDAGTKKVLGRSGKFEAQDIVAICLDQPACARFLARKLYRFFVSETAEPGPELLEPLAEAYRRSNYDTAAVVALILKSEHFFSPASYRQKVKDPVEFAVGIVQGLEGTVGPLPLAEAIEPLGQMLFAPPSVKGWDGGPIWLNAQTLLFRQNLALALTSTQDGRFGRRCDPVATLARHQITDEADAVEFFLTVFLQNDVSKEARAKLLEYQNESRKASYPVFWSREDVRQHRLRTLAHLTLTRPEFQLA